MPVVRVVRVLGSQFQAFVISCRPFLPAYIGGWLFSIHRVLLFASGGLVVHFQTHGLDSRLGLPDAAEFAASSRTWSFDGNAIYIHFEKDQQR